MKAKGLKIIPILSVSLVFAITPAVSADSVQDLVNQGNRLYDKGNFNEAIKEYDQALIDQPQALEPKFNQANCYFQLDDLAKAIDLYNEVAAESKDMGLVAKAKYNLGNCYFQQGSKQKDSNLQKALEDLQTSIVYWRSTLEIDPENEKAAKNIEVARLIIKDIIDQINKQKQQQEQQAAKQKQLQEQLKEILERQKALAGQTQETKNQEDNELINKHQAGENYTKQAGQQSQLKSETEQASQQLQQQDPNSPMPMQFQQAADELNKAVDKQADAEMQLNAADGNSAEQSQDKAVKHLENALEALSGDNQQNQQQQQEQQQEQQSQQDYQDPNEAQQQQEAIPPDTTAEDILNKEQREKKQRQILQRSGYQKVDKDW